MVQDFVHQQYDELVKYSGLAQLQDDVDTQAADVDADDDAPAAEGEASDGALAPTWLAGSLNNVPSYMAKQIHQKAYM